MLLRFVAGRPVSPVTCAFLAWVAERLAAEGMRVLALVWDNAAWHVSREVHGWVRDHNRRVKRDGGCRLLICRLPSKSPWLNPIEPRWAHGKRAVTEPERKLTGDELQRRLCDHYRCSRLPPLALGQPQAIAGQRLRLGVRGIGGMHGKAKAFARCRPGVQGRLGEAREPDLVLKAQRPVRSTLGQADQPVAAAFFCA
jgi:transposase